MCEPGYEIWQIRQLLVPAAAKVFEVVRKSLFTDEKGDQVAHPHPRRRREHLLSGCPRTPLASMHTVEVKLHQGFRQSIRTARRKETHQAGSRHMFPAFRLARRCPRQAMEHPGMYFAEKLRILPDGSGNDAVTNMPR